MYSEISVNYGYGLNTNEMVLDIAFDVKVYSEISVNYGYSLINN